MNEFNNNNNVALPIGENQHQQQPNRITIKVDSYLTSLLGILHGLIIVNL